jgi:single-strand DNA-binding protein
MSNFNKVLLMGRLTRDPELRYTPQGVPVSEIGLAVNREYTVGTERRKDTAFVDITLWRRQAEVVCQYLKKGAPIFIEGHLALDSWEGQDGQKRSKLRVVAENFQFLGNRQDGEGARSMGEAGGDVEGGGYPSSSSSSSAAPRRSFTRGASSSPPAGAGPGAPRSRFQEGGADRAPSSSFSAVPLPEPDGPGAEESSTRSGEGDGPLGLDDSDIPV